MSCPVDQQSLERLKQFLTFVKVQPNILHLPQLEFFRDFIESLGGKIPEIQMPSEAKSDTPEPDVSAEEVESEPESEVELDMTGCVEPDKLEDNQRMGDSTKEVSEEDSDKADEKRVEAQSKFADGDIEKSIELYSEAIELNPNSALFFAKRGQAYLKLTKPNACIKDCTRALELNPDSATAYKFRGRAYRLLGEWELAAKDLRQACTIDFDEQTDEWLKEVTPNAKKIEEHLLKKERKRKDKEEEERLDRIRKAKEAHAKASTQSEASESVPPGGTPGAGMPPMGDFYKLLQDPEILSAVQDPEVAQAFEDITKNPANMLKYQSNPKIAALLQKLTSKFAGAGMPFGGGAPFGGAGGPPFGAPGAGATPPSGGDDLD